MVNLIQSVFPGFFFSFFFFRTGVEVILFQSKSIETFPFHALSQFWTLQNEVTCKLSRMKSYINLVIYQKQTKNHLRLARPNRSLGDNCLWTWEKFYMYIEILKNTSYTHFLDFNQNEIVFSS